MRGVRFGLAVLLIGMGVLLLAGAGVPEVASRGPGVAIAESVSGPAPPPPTPPLPAADAELVAYEGPVEHIFFHPLIVYPELAFDGDGMEAGYDDWFATAREFRLILEALYQRGYILVDFRDVVEEEPGGMEQKQLMLPRGKKPLIISIDDLNYYEYMRANGNAYKLIVDTDGTVKTYSVSPEGRPVISADDEIISILDAFVSRHPDFSFHGAKGVIALTGYEGILGYRTNERSAPGYETEMREAMAVVRRLKETGWSFASHGWGHLDAAKISAETLARDTRRWKEEVEPLIGPTPVYIYPFGSAPAPGDRKLQILRDLGFRVFCAVGPAPGLTVTGGSVFTERRHIDGLALRTQRQMLLHLFDADAVIDEVRPKR